MRRLALVITGAFFSTSIVAHADCFDDAATYQHVNANVLRALAWQESHNQPGAVHANKNGSVDYGVMQINSIHLSELSRYGVDKTTLLEPCNNVYIAAWQLRRQTLKYGDTWLAIGAYHSETPTLRDGYAHQVATILHHWIDSGLIDTNSKDEAHWPSRIAQVPQNQSR
jgi:soluble lytic murein transglycosylase-like protein